MTGKGFDFMSKETLLLLNNVFFTVSAAMVLLGTLYPLIIDLMGWGQISVGPPYFGAMFILLMTPVVMLMPLGPFARWGQDELRRVLLPLVAALLASGVGALIIVALLDAWSARAFLGWMGGLWLILGSFQYWYSRNSQSRFSLPRHQLGMILAHAGVGVFVIGVAMVESSTYERDVRLEPGQSITAAGYEFVLDEVVSVKGPNWIADEARFSILKNGELVESMAPQKRRYHQSGQTMTQVALRPGLFKDLYLAMGERLDDSSNAWSIRIHVKPFIRWIWGGALLLAIGATLAASDRRYRLKQRQEAEGLAGATGASVA